MFNARVSVDPDQVIAPVSRRLFGSFVEHLGRCVYGGIHEPGHPSADASGWRTDVLDLVRELGVSTVRYPGGNFVSGYRWEDGVGPVADRPRRLDLAWHSTEPNTVGLDEFAGWSRKAGVELMYAVNLGTRDIQHALDVLEYANIASGTELSDQRVRNGSPEPHDIRMWCLGNEMDGPWQLGHCTALEYGRRAARTARAMRQVDSGLELVVCGSSGAGMPTFGEWERTVLSEAYDEVDFISCHAYYEPHDGDLASFLASAVGMDAFIDTVAAVADEVKAERGSAKTMQISFDEWNVWYMSRYEKDERITDPAVWPVAPRLLEDRYTVVDAVVVGNLLISLLRHADRVTAASQAQLVNVIAPIMTEPGGPAWRQATFHPFALTSRLASGVVVGATVSCPTQVTGEHGEVPVVDAAVTRNESTGALSVFLVNRSLDEEAVVELDVAALPSLRVGSAQTLSDPDLSAANTVDERDRVRPAENRSATIADGRLTITLPPVSWTALTLEVAG